MDPRIRVLATGRPDIQSSLDPDLIYLFHPGQDDLGLDFALDEIHRYV